MVLFYSGSYLTRLNIHSLTAPIHYSTGQQDPIRNIQRALEHLEKEGYIKRFIVKGKKSDYPILIHRYEVTDAR